MAPGDRPLRLLMASPVYAPCVGGGERLLQMVAEGLASRGHQVTVVTLDAATHGAMMLPSGSGLPREDRLNGVRLIRAAPGGGRLAGALRTFRRLRGGYRSTQMLLGRDADRLLGPPSGVGIVAALLRRKADLILSANWGFMTAEAADWAARWTGAPVVALPLLHIARPWAQDPRFHRLLPRTTSVVALTQSEARFVRARGARRVEVIGCGVDSVRFGRAPSDRFRRMHGLSDGPVVGFIGRQDVLKGVPTLIKAMRVVWPSLPDITLLLAGPSAHRDQATRAALADLSPEQRARVLLVDDFADADAPDILDACDVVALPSVEEAFGLVYLEAWMRRRPVVGVRVPSTEDVIAHGSDGLIVEPMNPEALAKALGDLLRCPERRAAMGAEGHRKVTTRYTLGRIVDQWEGLLHSVTTEARRS